MNETLQGQEKLCLALYVSIQLSAAGALTLGDVETARGRKGSVIVRRLASPTWSPA